MAFGRAHSSAVVAACVAGAFCAAAPLPSCARAARPTVLEKLPYSAGVLLARAIREGRVGVPPRQPPPLANPGKLSCGPAPCVLHNVAASNPDPVDETPIVANPANPDEVLTAGNDFACPGKPGQGFYLSIDRGGSWNSACGQVAQGWYQTFADPVVAFNSTGVAFAGGLNTDQQMKTGIAAISRSTDGGVTWSAPVVAVTNINDGFVDKDWMQIDTGAASPYKDAIYVSATQFEPQGTQISVSHSNDGGSTWTTVAATPIVTGTTAVEFSDLAIGADGTVYLSWMQCTAGGATNDCGGTVATMFTSSSTDGGSTWSNPVPIHEVTLAPDTCGAFYGCLPNTSEPVSDIPAIAIDNSTQPGTLYEVDYTWTGVQMKVRVAASTDGGATWGNPAPVAPKRFKQDQFFPWIGAGAKGRIGVTWLDRRNDPSNVDYDAYGAVTTDGITFSDRRLSKVSSDPFDDGFGGVFMGDYTGNAWGGNYLFAAWPDTRSGTAAQDEVGGIRR